jgi:hypothetical protein
VAESRQHEGSRTARIDSVAIAIGICGSLGFLMMLGLTNVWLIKKFFSPRFADIERELRRMRSEMETLKSEEVSDDVSSVDSSVLQELRDEIAVAKSTADKAKATAGEAKKDSADAKDAASHAQRDATSAQDAVSNAKNAVDSVKSSIADSV